jgi:hypothetical protein
MTRQLLTLTAVLLAGTCARAQVESGPKAGEKVMELKVHAVSGSNEGKEVDYPAERKDEPTVYLFVNAEKFSRPIHRYIKTLDDKLPQVNDKLAAVAVWVTADGDKSKEFLAKIKQYYNNTSLTVFGGGANGPNGWGVNEAAHLTVVIAHKGKVVKSFAYESISEKDVDAVEAELKKAVEKK